MNTHGKIPHPIILKNMVKFVSEVLLENQIIAFRPCKMLNKWVSLMRQLPNLVIITCRMFIYR